MSTESASRTVPTLPVWPFFVVAAGLLIALLTLPYGYYTLLRLAVAACSAYGFVAFTQLRLWGVRWLFVPIALLFLFGKMRREDWAPLDLGVACAFVLAGAAAGAKQWLLARKARFR